MSIAGICNYLFKNVFIPRCVRKKWIYITMMRKKCKLLSLLIFINKDAMTYYEALDGHLQRLK